MEYSETHIVNICGDDVTIGFYTKDGDLISDVIAGLTEIGSINHSSMTIDEAKEHFEFWAIYDKECKANGHQAAVNCIIQRFK